MVKRIRKHIKGNKYAYACIVLAIIGIAPLIYTYTIRDSVSMYEYVVDIAPLILVIIGFYLAIWRLKFSEEQLTNQGTQLTYQGEQIEIQREKDASQHFLQGVEFLASANAAMRIEAVRTLDKLAKEEKHQKEYLEKIADTFMLHLREQGQKQKEKKKEKDRLAISEDMQAILDVFFRIGDYGRYAQRRGSVEYAMEKVQEVKRRFNFFGLNLRGAMLEHSNMRDIALNFSDLRFANIKFSHLNKSRLAAADLRSVSLGEATMEGTDFSGVLVSPHPAYVISYYMRIECMSVDEMDRWNDIFPSIKYSYTDKQLKADLERIYALHKSSKSEEEWVNALKKEKHKMQVTVKGEEIGHPGINPMSVRKATIKDAIFFDVAGIEDVAWKEAREPEKLFKNNKNQWPKAGDLEFHPLKGWIKHGSSSDDVAIPKQP